MKKIKVCLRTRYMGQTIEVVPRQVWPDEYMPIRVYRLMAVKIYRNDDFLGIIETVAVIDPFGNCRIDVWGFGCDLWRRKDDGFEYVGIEGLIDFVEKAVRFMREVMS